MSGFLIAMTYLLVWWLVLFPLLSVGQQLEEVPDTGHASGAPRRTHLGKKMLMATVLAVFITWGIVAFVNMQLAKRLQQVEALEMQEAEPKAPKPQNQR